MSNDHIIYIEGLNTQQRRLADILWAMDTIDSVLAFRNSLRAQQQRDCDTVLRLMVCAEIDRVTEDQREFPEVSEILDQYR